MLVQNVLTRVETVANDAAGNVVAPIGRHTTQPEVVGRSTRRTFTRLSDGRRLTRLGVAVMRALLPVPARASDHVRVGAKSSLVDTAVFGREERMTVVLVFYPRSWSIDPIGRLFRGGD